ncbi:hypothetical protein F2Q68_00006836 [Brassica cretica]|uniref:Uncharacterized protein n=1 Tax=Brassica cretica TaxID=69181 RepID=A0A8S9J4H8_BRACR|nr:hypothetical protein F2Q68_00006836 [Brassica cretica]
MRRNKIKTSHKLISSIYFLLRVAILGTGPDDFLTATAGPYLLLFSLSIHLCNNFIIVIPPKLKASFLIPPKAPPCQLLCSSHKELEVLAPQQLSMLQAHHPAASFHLLQFSPQPQAHHHAASSHLLLFSPQPLTHHPTASSCCFFLFLAYDILSSSSSSSSSRILLSSDFLSSASSSSSYRFLSASSSTTFV